MLPRGGASRSQSMSASDVYVPCAAGSALHDDDGLDGVARIVAAALLRLHVKRAATVQKRGVSRDNLLGCPGETRPPAVNLQRKG